MPVMVYYTYNQCNTSRLRFSGNSWMDNSSCVTRMDFRMPCGRTSSSKQRICDMAMGHLALFVRHGMNQHWLSGYFHRVLVLGWDMALKPWKPIEAISMWHTIRWRDTHTWFPIILIEKRFGKRLQHALMFLTSTYTQHWSCRFVFG